MLIKSQKKRAESQKNGQFYQNESLNGHACFKKGDFGALSLYGSKTKCPRTDTVFFPLSEISEETISLLLLACLFHLSSRPHGLWAVHLLHFCYSLLASKSMRIPFSRPWMSAMISFPAHGSVQ